MKLASIGFLGFLAMSSLVCLSSRSVALALQQPFYQRARLGKHSTMIDPTLPRYCRIHSHSSTVSNTAIRMLLTAEETENSNGKPVKLKAPALSSTPIQEENNNEQIISSLYHLKKYKTNRDVESAIVRLGRKGKTDKAL